MTVNPDQVIVDQLAAAGGGVQRPRLRSDHPLLWRGDGRLQIGIGERVAVIGDATMALAKWLRAIDGTRDWVQLAVQLTSLGIAVEQAQRSLWSARSTGALDDAATMPDALRWSERSTRDAVASDHAAASFTYGDSTTANLVIDRRLTTRVSVLGAGRVAEELREALAISGMTLADDAADLRILAGATHPWAVDTGACELLPHLPVAVFGDIGEIGPLVIPGRTSCLRCAYLHRRDADPDWPMLSLQFDQAVRRIHVQPSDRLLTRSTALTAVLLVRRWADDPLAAEAWGDQILQVHLPDGNLVRRPAPAHGLCGCCWPEQAA